MSEVKLIGCTIPVQNLYDMTTSEDLISWCARVSSPQNQGNFNTANRLLEYCIRNKHWSPFEMVNVVMEINTTRDIARQILRHRSFSFQEFSQRYAQVLEDFESRETRLQDKKNRQNSIDEGVSSDLDRDWQIRQKQVQDLVSENYQWAIDNNIAKEQARVILPEGMTKSRMYMNGTLRSWIHYCQLRMGNGTQKEHQEIARMAWDILKDQYPFLECLEESESQYSIEVGTMSAKEAETYIASLMKRFKKKGAKIPPAPPQNRLAYRGKKNK